MAKMEDDLAQKAAKKQAKSMGDWFERTNARADRRQLHHLLGKYGSLGDVTYDPIGKAWVLPTGAQSNSKARIGDRIAIPTKSSQRTLE